MSDSLSPPQSLTAVERHQRWRLLKDRFAGYGVALGGVSVIIAIVLIFFYLLYVVFPIFLPASADRIASYRMDGAGEKTLFLALEEQGGSALRITEGGDALFFDTTNGKASERIALVTGEERVVSVAESSAHNGLIAIGYDNGRALVVRYRFKVSYPDDVRTLTPEIEYPYGEEPLEVDGEGGALEELAFQDGEEQLALVARTTDGVKLAHFSKEVSMLDDETTLEGEWMTIPFDSKGVPEHLLLDPGFQRLYLAYADGELHHFDTRDWGAVELFERVNLLPPKERLGDLRFLTGGFSLLAGSSSGVVYQWFPVRDENNYQRLTPIRKFEWGGGALTAIAIEERRKGFVSADNRGEISVHHTTAARTVLTIPVSEGGELINLRLSPRANRMLAEESDGTIHFWKIENEHPEISWSSLWEKVHYEGYSEPTHTWQSSSADNDFEPKFSLTPLAFGTMKAAFYAMMIAVPLAIFGAIYTAYFMAPRMRQVVKPTIEIMEALPTVILGFLAGLWLAPVVEENLPGVFTLLLMMPLGVLLFGYGWHRLPRELRVKVPEGWEAALLVPIVIFLAWLSFELSPVIEGFLFGGDMRSWLHNELGISFDQRNSLVVGLAMGFAVIPTIFSIAEDAIFSVPKHLTFGSLALGATTWQTLSRVVILTASPGIFSAVMIGMGRAVGETMIVLMATGNTPVMDFSIFQGMRTLSANIAVEMPESEVASTHYRVLFLAALVLFIFTFFFNTVAEIVRQRLRRKYSSL